MDVEATKGVVGGLSMLLAPLLLLVGFAIHPPEPMSGAEALEVIVDDPGRREQAPGMCSLPCGNLCVC